MDSNLPPLALATLQPRHFPEIELSGRQLHVWCEITGIKPKSRESGKWRLFSPIDVMRLAVLRELKGRSGFPFSEQSMLLELIGGEQFPDQILKIWRQGSAPFLYSDFSEVHSVGVWEEIGSRARRRAPDFLVALNLDFSIFVMFRAVFRGGEKNQINEAIKLISEWHERCQVREKKGRRLELGNVELSREKAEELVQARLDK
ncbi:MerR family transcriptional regulator [Thalassospiraceae bacterium LMO-JJ14]|nr:MerR family transcriptional regulator [Thalassospiraceae bacterium LMO-JJ14]